MTQTLRKEANINQEEEAEEISYEEENFQENVENTQIKESEQDNEYILTKNMLKH